MESSQFRRVTREDRSVKVIVFSLLSLNAVVAGLVVKSPLATRRRWEKDGVGRWGSRCGCGCGGGLGGCGDRGACSSMNGA